TGVKLNVTRLVPLGITSMLSPLVSGGLKNMADGTPALPDTIKATARALEDESLRVSENWAPGPFSALPWVLSLRPTFVTNVARKRMLATLEVSGLSQPTFVNV